ncbi:MAG: chromosomal replication initiator protein DnaA, partial [Caldimonas sp.]
MRSDLWQRGCERLASELPDQQFNTWIRPLPDADVADNSEGAVVTVRVPNRFKLDWIRNQYAGRIESVLSELAGKPVRLDVTLAQRDGGARTGEGMASPAGRPVAFDVALRGAALATGQDGHGANAKSNGEGPGVAGGTAYHASHAAATLPSRSRLNPVLTFDTLVPGRANQMARTAALHVAGSPGLMYNPLFIYGGVGLGKTHLIHAVGNALLADRPDARILYLHAEQFITDVVKNYQRKTFDELKAKYHSLDLLLIDDVQFFAGKERTQEEFFNAFEALLAKRAHIIMTSDTYPKGLVDIDERLTSRFDAGLTVA